MPQQIPWQTLVDAAKKGDAQAISALYEQSYKTVFCTIRAMVSDEDTALDLTQDTFVKAFSSLEKLGDPEKFCAWVKVIGRNQTLNHLRTNRPMMFSELAPADSDDDYELPFEDTDLSNSPEAVMDQKETARLIREILGTLSDSQRLAVGMFYYENMSIKEIARQTGMSESSVKVHLHNGRKRIEEKVRALEKQGVKLYSLTPVPFLLWLLRSESKAFNPGTDPSCGRLLNRLSESGQINGAQNGSFRQTAQADSRAQSAQNADIRNTANRPSPAQSAPNQPSGYQGGYGTNTPAGYNAGTPAGYGANAPAGYGAGVPAGGMTGTSYGASASGAGTYAAAAAAGAGAKAAGGSLLVKVLAGVAAFGIVAGAGFGAVHVITSKNAESEHEPETVEETVTETEPEAEAPAEVPEETETETAEVTEEPEEPEEPEPEPHIAPVASQSVEVYPDYIVTTSYDAKGNMILQLGQETSTAWVYTYDEEENPVSAVEYGPDGTFDITYTAENGLITHVSRVSEDGSSNLGYESDITYTLRDDGQPEQKVEVRSWDWGAVVTMTTDYTYNDAGDCVSEVTSYSGEYDVDTETWTYEVNENGERTACTHEVVYKEGDVVTTTIDFTYGDPAEETLYQPLTTEAIAGVTWSVNYDYTHNYSLYAGDALLSQSTVHEYKLSFIFHEDGTVDGIGYYTENGAEKTVTETGTYTISGNMISMPGWDLTLIAVWDGTQWVLAVPNGSAVMMME